MTRGEARAALARARRYPYRIPRRSFVYRDGAVEPFDASLTGGRTAVLAIGSNQAPERLEQKFGRDGGGSPLPVQRARLGGFDVVYSAHVASYGAVPAMLEVSAGARVEIAVTWLDDGQAEVMHASEIAAANYAFSELDGIDLELDDGRRLGRAYAYTSERGYLPGPDGEPVALAAVACEGRRYRALDTAGALELVRARLAPERGADRFVLDLATDAAARRVAIEALAGVAGPSAVRARLVRRR